MADTETPANSEPGAGGTAATRGSGAHSASGAWLTADDWRWAVLAALVAAAPYLLYWMLGEHPVGVDYVRSGVSMACALSDGLRDGSLLVTPDIGAGMPFWFRPAARVLIPTRWLAALMPPFEAEMADVVIHVALAGGFTYLLGRTFRVARAPALLAALAFALSGTVADLPSHAFYRVAAPGLATTWFFARMALHQPSTRACLLLAASGFFVLASGEPQTYCIGLALVLVEGICTRRLRMTYTTAAIFLAGGALAAITWSPVFAELEFAGRAQGLSGHRLMWSYGPEQWPAAIIPNFLSDFWGNGDDITVHLNGLGKDAAWNREPTVGLVTLLLAILGLFERRARRVAAVTLGAYLLALGHHVPVSAWVLQHVPGPSYFRYPEKYLVIAHLGTALLAGIAMHRLPSVPKRGWMVALGGILTALLGGLALGWLAPHSDALDMWASEGTTRWNLPLMSAWLQGKLWYVVALGCTVALTGVASARGQTRILPLVWALEIAWVGFSTMQFGPALGEPVSPVIPIAEAAPDALFCEASGRLPGAVILPGHQKTAWDKWSPHWVWLPSDVNTCADVPLGTGYSPMSEIGRRHLGAYAASGLTWAMRAQGCTYVVARGTPTGATPTPWFTKDGSPVFRLPGSAHLSAIPDPIPTVFAATDVHFVPGHAQQTTSALLSSLEPMSAAEMVSVVDDPRGASWEGGEFGAVEHVTLTRDAPHQLTVQATGTGRAIVGVRQAWYGGWTAAQQGTPLRVLRAAGNMLAADVPDVSAGPIVFTYRTPGFTRGLGIAAGALLGLLWLLWSGHRARQTADGPPQTSAS